MKVNLEGLFSNVVHSTPAGMRDYFAVCMDEVLDHLKEVVAGKHTIQEFAEHYCLSERKTEEPRNG